jgi:methionyl-tRNA formyltransferase
MGDEGARDHGPLRIALFSVLPLAHWLVHTWAAQKGHTVPLIVTTPGPPQRRGTGFREVVAQASPDQDVLITSRPARAASHLTTHAPDLLLCFGFSFLLAPSLLAVPRLGAYNLHPTPLPRYRGSNPQRMLYDGAQSVGATLHRMDGAFDHGPILSRHERPVAADASGEQITQTWVETMAAALTEGVARALAGEPGEPQDEALASYGARFTADEYWLDWHWPRLVVQRRAIALNIFGVQARALIDGRLYAVFDATAVADKTAAAAPGTVLSREGDIFAIQATDGVLRVAARPFDAASGGHEA